MTKKAILKDKNGASISPITTYEAVMSSDGITNLDTQLKQMDNKASTGFAKVNSSLADIVDIGSEKNNINKCISTNGCVVFVDDDCRKGSLQLKDLFDRYNKKCTFAVITGSTGTTNFMSFDDLKMLQNNDFEICSHTHNHLNLSTLTKKEQEREMILSITECIKNGIKIDNLVYPYNAYNKDTLDLSLKYFKSACTLKGSRNKIPLAQDTLSRIGLGSYQINSTSDLKIEVDRAKANNELLIFMTHAYAEDGVPVEGNLGAIEIILKHCIANDVPVMTLRDSLTFFGNIVNAGNEFTENYYKVGANGKTYTKKGSAEYFKTVEYMDGSESVATLRAKYGDSVLCSIIPSNVSALGFIPKMGTLLTLMPTGGGYASQTLYEYATLSEYKRVSLATGEWGAWKQKTNVGLRHDFVTAIADIIPNNYPKNEMVISIVTSNICQGMPENKPGLLTTYTFSDVRFWKQEYAIYDSNITYVRKPLDDNTWKAWQKYSQLPV